MRPAAVESLASDVRGAEALRAKASSGDPEALRAAAKQFEAMFLQIVFKTMRQTRFSTEGDPFANSSSLKLYQELLDQQWSQRIVAGRGLGFAEAMYNALSRNAALATMPADQEAALRNESQAMRAESQAVRVEGQVMATAYSGGNFPADPDGSASNPEASAESAKPESIKQAFIDTMRPHAEKAGQALGVPANFILAQAALESGWGRREIVGADGTRSYNLFGIKAGAKWKGAVVEQMTTEYQQGLVVKKTQVFRAYAGYEEAFENYAALLKQRFPLAASAGTSADDFAFGLVAGGYATDPAYGDKILRLIAGLA